MLSLLVSPILAAKPYSGTISYSYYYQQSWNSPVFQANAFYVTSLDKMSVISPAYQGFLINDEVEDSYATVYINITVDSPQRLYIGLFSQFGYSEQWDFGFLEDYYNPSATFTINDFPCDSVPVNFYRTQSTWAVGDVSRLPYNVTFYVFDNVPSGLYTTSCRIANRIVGHYYGCGVYGTDPSIPSGSSVVDQFVSGDITYQEAIDQLNSDYSQQLSQATSIEEKIFVTELAIYNTQVLNSVTNTVSSSNVKEMHTANNSVIQNYQPGSASSFSSSVTSLRQNYEDALESASTPDEITALNEQFTLDLAKLAEERDLAYDNDIHDGLDEFDSKLEDINDYTDQLWEASNFDDFASYLDLVDPSQYFDIPSFTGLVSIWEYLLTDKRLYLFIIAPAFLTIFTVILHTRLKG